MKDRVDRETGQGHALGHSVPAEVFTLDDDGYSNVREREGAPGTGRRRVLSCPASR
jgi:hypothetical protein